MSKQGKLIMAGVAVLLLLGSAVHAADPAPAGQAGSAVGSEDPDAGGRRGGRRGCWRR